MAGRIRTVKPEWIEDEKLLLASPAARTLSIAMLLLADDYGRGRCNKEIIVSRIFPGHSREGSEGFEELRETGYFATYVVRDQTYFWILNWGRHQRVDKPGVPRVPCPCGILEKDHDCLANFRETLATDLIPRPNTTTTTTLLRTEGAPVSFDFESVYEIYPRKKGKSKGLALCKSKIRSQQTFDKFSAAVRRMGELWSGASKADLEFCPHFSTFVSGKRWEDDELPAPKVNGSSNPRVGHYQHTGDEQYAGGEVKL